MRWFDGALPSRTKGTPFDLFHSLYWDIELLSEDEPTPGLGGFVHFVRDAGGEVVFLSGRWRFDQVVPSLKALRRAGVAKPSLVIGNAWHENHAQLQKKVLSDAEIKAHHINFIKKRFGSPVAVIDDREKNRAAIVAACGGGILSVGISIPGFTSDPANIRSAGHVTTFESPSLQNHSLTKCGPTLSRLNVSCPSGEPTEIYCGLGPDKQEYFLPRRVEKTGATSASEAIFLPLIQGHQVGSITEENFLKNCEPLICPKLLAEFRAAIDMAFDLADATLGAAVERSEYEGVWRSMRTACLHARDIDLVLRQIGYECPDGADHDLRELVRGAEVRDNITRRIEGGQKYSAWFMNWLSLVGLDEQVNVGFLNPHLLVSLWRWRPDSGLPQDGMDVHRLSAHHRGDGALRHNPIETVVNNLLHQREGTSGVRKEAVQSWDHLERLCGLPSAAEDLFNGSFSPVLALDVIHAARGMERDGILTPWGLTVGASF